MTLMPFRSAKSTILSARPNSYLPGFRMDPFPLHGIFCGYGVEMLYNEGHGPWVSPGDLYPVHGGANQEVTLIGLAEADLIITA